MQSKKGLPLQHAKQSHPLGKQAQKASVVSEASASFRGLGGDGLKSLRPSPLEQNTKAVVKLPSILSFSAIEAVFGKADLERQM